MQQSEQSQSKQSQEDLQENINVQTQVEGQQQFQKQSYDLKQSKSAPDTYQNIQQDSDDIDEKLTKEQIQQIRKVKNTVSRKRKRKVYIDQPPNTEHATCNRKVALQSLVAKSLWIIFHAFCLTVLIVVPETTLTSTSQPQWILPVYSGFFLVNIIVYLVLWFADPGVQTERLSLNPQAYVQEKQKVRVYGHPPKGKDRDYDKENALHFNFGKKPQGLNQNYFPKNTVSEALNPLQEKNTYNNIPQSDYDRQMANYYGENNKNTQQDIPPLDTILNFQINQQQQPMEQSQLDRFQILQDYQRQMNQQYKRKDQQNRGPTFPAPSSQKELQQKLNMLQLSQRYNQNPNSQENSVLMQSDIRDIYDQMESGFDAPSSKNYSYSSQFFNPAQQKTIPVDQTLEQRQQKMVQQQDQQIQKQQSTSELLKQYSQDQQQLQPPNNLMNQESLQNKQLQQSKGWTSKFGPRNQTSYKQAPKLGKVQMSDENFTFKAPNEFEGFITQGCRAPKKNNQGNKIAQSSMQFIGDVSRLMNPNVRISMRSSGQLNDKLRYSQINHNQGPYKSIRQSQYKQQIIKDIQKHKDDKYILGTEWWSNDNPGKYCKYCKVWQPLRAKHCHECNRCVRKFDHHCEWIGNCVGEKNHPLFLFYLFIQSVVIIWSLYFAVRGIVPVSKHHVIWKIVFLSLDISIIGVFGFFSVLLFVYHCMLAFTNQLSYERIKADKLEYIIDYPSEAWMFNEGCTANCYYFMCCNGNHSQYYLYRTSRILEPEIAEAYECYCCQSQCCS